MRTIMVERGRVSSAGDRRQMIYWSVALNWRLSRWRWGNCASHMRTCGCATPRLFAAAMCNPPNPARVARQNIVCTLAPVRRPSTCNTCFLRSQLLRSQLPTTLHLVVQSNNPPSYRGVSKAVSPMPLPDRHTHATGALHFSLAHLLSVRARGSSTVAEEAAGDGCGPPLA